MPWARLWARRLPVIRDPARQGGNYAEKGVGPLWRSLHILGYLNSTTCHAVLCYCDDGMQFWLLGRASSLPVCGGVTRRAWRLPQMPITGAKPAGRTAERQRAWRQARGNKSFSGQSTVTSASGGLVACHGGPFNELARQEDPSIHNWWHVYGSPRAKETVTVSSTRCLTFVGNSSTFSASTSCRQGHFNPAAKPLLIVSDYRAACQLRRGLQMP